MKTFEIIKDSSKEIFCDYDFSWDYEPAKVRKEDLELVSECVQEVIQLNLDWLSSFKVGLIKLDNGAVATYIDGTSSHFHVGLDLYQIKRLSKKLGLDFKKQLFISICHEFYHGFQDLNDLEYDCDDAEDFAVAQYFEFSLKFKKVDPPLEQC